MFYSHSPLRHIFFMLGLNKPCNERVLKRSLENVLYLHLYYIKYKCFECE